MSKSFLGVVGLFCLVACGSEAGSPSPVGGGDPAPGTPGAVVPGAGPAAPVVKAVGDDGAVKLSWAAVAGATSYDVARATTAGGEAVITNVTDPSFADTGVDADTTYFYTVTAKNDAGSAASAEVSATPFSFDKLRMRHNAQPFRAIAEGNGTILAVGDGMRVIRSTDGGATWTDARLPGYGGINGVAYGAGKFVVVGGYGQILTSADGLTWEPQQSGVTDIALTGVAFGGKTTKRFVAIGPGSTILSSPDGVTWTPVTNNLHHTSGSTFDYKLKTITYGDAATFDYFVITAGDNNGNGGYAFYLAGDSDLSTWAPSPAGSMGFLLGAPINGATFGKFQGGAAAVPSFHLVGTNGFWAHVEETAPGTLSFATVTAGTNADTWAGAAFDGNDTLAVFSQAGKVMSCSISTSCKFGMNGFAVETTPANNGFWAATYAGGKLVGVGNDELVMGKAAGGAFAELHRSSPSFTHLLTKNIASVGTNVIAAGTFGGRYLYSNDGGEHFASVDAPNANSLYGAKAINGKLFMVGGKSTIMSSDTGGAGTWNVATVSPTTETLYAIGAGPSLYIAAGDKGLFTSPDGATWTHQNGAGHPIAKIEWEGTQFIATTFDGRILTTTDGVQFQEALFDQTQGMSLEGLAIDGNTIVVTGREGHVWMSTDHGATFQPHHIAEAPALVGLARFDGRWIAGGSNQRPELWTSDDAITWKRRTSIPTTIYSVDAAAGKLFVAGMMGAIYSTPKL